MRNLWPPRPGSVPVRTYENAARFIGQTSAAMDGMLRSSALIQLEMKKGFGSGAEWFRTMGRGMQDARIRINGASDAQEYLNRVIEEGAKITDSRLKRSFFEALTGMPELSRLTAENLRTAQQYLTQLSAKQREDLTELQESFEKLGLSPQRFRAGIEAELAPAIAYLSDSVRQWLDGPLGRAKSGTGQSTAGRSHRFGGLDGGGRRFSAGDWRHQCCLGPRDYCVCGISRSGHSGLRGL
jgi:hypothetical protein